ncbi:MAG: c-type cytochrome domain-containing protein, partial [Bryobacteraceae bacterium]
MQTRILWLVLLSSPAFLSAANTIDFNRDVRPILSDKCYLCHGPDAKAKHIPLRLDHEADAKAALPDGKHAVLEGHPEQSEMIHRITAQNKGMRMPPVYSGLKLTDQQIETLRNWIAQGAKWEKHWAFLPPKRPEIPVVKNAKWVRNPIDAFVMARLDREGLTPSPEANRATLIRRVTLDLT